MPLTPYQVILYAADPADFKLALGAAAVNGVPTENVTGTFMSAWSYTASGKYLVLAVGAAAGDALYYNPCGWSNPASQPGGGTPFAFVAQAMDTLPPANHFLLASGATGADTLASAVATAHFAVTGTWPAGIPQPGTTIAPVDTCRGSAQIACPCRLAPGVWTCGSPSYRRGIDISSNNPSETTNPAFWTGAKNEGVSFAIIKASEGSTYTNPDLPGQYSAATQVLGENSIGLYHFLDWQYPGDQQAQHFYRTISALAPSFAVSTGLRLWLDVEEPNGTSSTGTPSVDTVTPFMSKLAELCRVGPAQSAGVYTNRHTWVNLLGNPASFSTHPLWAAEPNGASCCPAPFGGWNDWTVLQYATDLTVAGYGGFDGNQLKLS